MRSAVGLAMLVLTQAACLDVLLIAAVHEGLGDDQPPTRAEKIACEQWLAANPNPPPPLDECLDICSDPQWDYYGERSRCVDVVQRYDRWQASVREALATDPPAAEP